MSGPPPGPLSMADSLMDPAAYPPSPALPARSPVTRISTHISDVFLVGEFAYKVKKPVDFGFCNFSTPGLRRQFSEREVELNGRLSHGVYLSVEPVNLDATSGRYSIGGEGEQVDWAVKMRRLRSEDQLDRLLENGEAGPAEIRQIAQLLAGFHMDAPHAPTKHGTADAVSGIVLGNLGRVAEHAPPGLDAAAFANISAYANAFLKRRGDLVQRRHRDGMPRMCHGDLHAGNIFFERQPGGQRSPQIIDCIEFNDSFIYIDPAADIAFLSMDLKRRGFPELAAELIETYVTASGDTGMAPLLPFYESYRAMVRCMAGSISAEQAALEDRQRHVDDANAYLRLACETAARDRPQFLAITAGVTGTGKSTVAGLISDQWNAVRLNTDTIRRELAGIGLTERTGSEVRAGIYTGEMSRRVYDEMHRRAREELAAGRSVIMDGTHLQRHFRKSSLDEGRDAGVLTVIVECSLEKSEALRRLESRYSTGMSESEGRPEVYADQLPAWEAPADDEADAVARVDTGGAIGELPRRLFGALWDAVFAAAS